MKRYFDATTTRSVQNAFTIAALIVTCAVSGCSSSPSQHGAPSTSGGESGGPASVTDQTLQDAIHSTLNVGNDVAWMVETDTRMVAEAVLEASVQGTGGNSLRFYGTLSQQGPNAGFSYSDQPQDHLLLILASGQHIDIVVHKLAGYLDGTMDDFLNSHEMDYNLASADVVDIHVTSRAVPNGADTDGNITVQGRAKSADGWLQIDMTRHRVQHEEVDVDWAQLRRTDDYSGSVSGPSGTVHITERDGFTYQAFKGTHARNFSIESHSSFELAGRSFSLRDSYLQWEDATVFNGGRNDDQTRTIIVSDPQYWQARGSLVEGDQVLGSMGFSGPVQGGTKGPDIILTLQDGTALRVVRPIERP